MSETASEQSVSFLGLVRRPQQCVCELSALLRKNCSLEEYKTAYLSLGDVHGGCGGRGDDVSSLVPENGEDVFDCIVGVLESDRRDILRFVLSERVRTLHTHTWFSNVLYTSLYSLDNPELYVWLVEYYRRHGVFYHSTMFNDDLLLASPRFVRYFLGHPNTCVSSAITGGAWRRNLVRLCQKDAREFVSIMRDCNLGPRSQSFWLEVLLGHRHLNEMISSTSLTFLIDEYCKVDENLESALAEICEDNDRGIADCTSIVEMLVSLKQFATLRVFQRLLLSRNGDDADDDDDGERGNNEAQRYSNDLGDAMRAIPTLGVSLSGAENDTSNNKSSRIKKKLFPGKYECSRYFWLPNDPEPRREWLEYYYLDRLECIHLHPPSDLTDSARRLSRLPEGLVMLNKAVGARSVRLAKHALTLPFFSKQGQETKSQDGGDATALISSTAKLRHPETVANLAKVFSGSIALLLLEAGADPILFQENRLLYFGLNADEIRRFQSFYSPGSMMFSVGAYLLNVIPSDADDQKDAAVSSSSHTSPSLSSSPCSLSSLSSSSPSSPAPRLLSESSPSHHLPSCPLLPPLSDAEWSIMSAIPSTILWGLRHGLIDCELEADVEETAIGKGPVSHRQLVSSRGRTLSQWISVICDLIVKDERISVGDIRLIIDAFRRPLRMYLKDSTSDWSVLCLSRHFEFFVDAGIVDDALIFDGIECHLSELLRYHYVGESGMGRLAFCCHVIDRLQANNLHSSTHFQLYNLVVANAVMALEPNGFDRYFSLSVELAKIVNPSCLYFMTQKPKDLSLFTLDIEPNYDDFIPGGATRLRTKCPLAAFVGASVRVLEAIQNELRFDLTQSLVEETRIPLFLVHLAVDNDADGSTDTGIWSCVRHTRQLVENLRMDPSLVYWDDGTNVIMRFVSMVLTQKITSIITQEEKELFEDQRLATLIGFFEFISPLPPPPPPAPPSEPSTASSYWLVEFVEPL